MRGTTAMHSAAATAITTIWTLGASGQVDVTAPENLVAPSSGGFTAINSNRIGPDTTVSLLVSEATSPLDNATQVVLSYEILATNQSGGLVVLFGDSLVESASIDGTTLALPDGTFADPNPLGIDPPWDFRVDVSVASSLTLRDRIRSAYDTVAADSNLVTAIIRFNFRDGSGNVISTMDGVNPDGTIDESVNESPVIDTEPLELLSVNYDSNGTPGDKRDDAVLLEFNEPLTFDGNISANIGANPARPNGTFDGTDATNRPGLDSLFQSAFRIRIDGAPPVPLDVSFDGGDFGSFADGNFTGRVVRLGLAKGGNLVPRPGTTRELIIWSPGRIVDVLRNDGAGLSREVTGDFIEVDVACVAADINDSGAVDLADLLILLSVFGSSDSASDVDESGFVDLTDLLSVLAEFGKFCA